MSVGNFSFAGLALAAVAATRAPAQAPRDSSGRVTAIAAARTPLPAEKASAKIKRFSFIAYGDTRNRNDGTDVQDMHSLVVASALGTIRALAKGPEPVKFVLHSGDEVVNGQVAAQLNVSFVPLIDRFTAGAGIPFFVTAGNHDVTGAQDVKNVFRAAGLANLFAAHKNLLPPEGSPRRLNGYPTYAFGYGNTFVLSFDSNIAGDSVQYRWVKAQLDSLDTKRFVNIIVFCHHPAFSTGPHGGSSVESSTLEMRQLYMPLFRTHHVKLLLTGHEHLFDHWVERYEDASGKYRLDQIVSGGGGAPIYTYSSEPDVRAYLAAGAAQHVALQHLVAPGADTTANPHHYLLVHVNGEKISVEVVGVGWGANYAPYPKGGVVLKK